MKVFIQDLRWDKRLNFVDDNNVVLGYEYDNSCCEYFGYELHDTEPQVKAEYEATPDEDIELSNERIEGFMFDTSYMKDISDNTNGDGDNVKVFRATKAHEEIYIVLFNIHNGYYGHGFDMKVGDLGIYEGCL